MAFYLAKKCDPLSLSLSLSLFQSKCLEKQQILGHGTHLSNNSSKLQLHLSSASLSSSQVAAVVFLNHSSSFNRISSVTR
jgi:hypothetical protein|uniref:Uncharacterized protein n=1 Tax=Populus trichocarpa TaxID=3694 RepID=A0A3N7FRN4_POPTR